MSRTPILIVTGYLGSGKTALLADWLTRPALTDSAVIVNEAGERPLDHHTLRRGAETVEALAAGCICCGIQGELIATLHKLLVDRERGRVPAFRRIVIETSGLADPAGLAAGILADGFLGEAAYLAGIVTCLDSVAGPDRLAAQPEAAAQVAVADALILTKTDLAAPTRVTALGEALTARNPTAAQTRVPPPGPAAAEILAELGAPRADGPAGDGHAHSHAETTVLSRHRPGAHGRATIEAMVQALKALGPDLLRLKAVLPVAEHPGSAIELQGAGHLMHPPVWHATAALAAGQAGSIMVACRAAAASQAEAALAQLAPPPS